MSKSDAERDADGVRHTKPKSGAAETARLRDDIDRGGGDKVAFSDPAAAPLGTDDEAGGNAPTPEQARRARHQETRTSETEGAKLTPGDLQAGSKKQKFGVGTIAIIAVVCVIVLLFFFY